MPTGYPYRLNGFVVDGLGIPTVGVSYGYGARGASGDAAVVDWETGLPECVDESAVARQCYLDGVLVGSAEDGARLIAIAGMRPGAQHDFQLLALSLGEHLRRPDGSATIFAAYRRGDRACLSWADQPEDDDFAAYVIYTDEGQGGTPDVELAVVEDLAATQYRSEPLDAGDYQFALAYRDTAGNESALGDVIDLAIPVRPPAVDNLAAAYSDSTRKATLTWDTPVGGWPAGTRRLAVFDNWAPGCQWLAPHANADPAYRRDDLPITETSWTSPNLWQGYDSAGALAPWRFDVRALLCDDYGADWGPSAAVTLTLVESAGTLSEVSNPPAAPTLTSAEPAAGAKYTARWSVQSLTDVTQFKVLQDGAEVATVAIGTGLGYSWTSGALSDGETYSIAVRAYNGSTAYSQSAALPVTVDGTAPTGDGVIAGELCQ